MTPDWIVPDWTPTEKLGAVLTSRNGGFSTGAFAGGTGGGMNLRAGEGEDPQAVVANRARLLEFLPAEPLWLRQVHGTTVIDAASLAPGTLEPVADGAFTRRRGIVCAVQTADCMPILFRDRNASVVGVAHAGWRGLAAGIVESMVQALELDPAEMLVFLGPSIGPAAFEVGDDVRSAFLDTMADASGAFVPHGPGKWLANLEMLARMRLARLGVSEVSGGGRCTLSEPRHFYSYRRDRITGRMAALIWLN